MVAVPLAQPETRSVAQIATQAAIRSLLTLALHLTRLVPAASPSSWERSRVKWTKLGRRPLPHPTSCGLLKQRDKHQISSQHGRTGARAGIVALCGPLDGVRTEPHANRLPQLNWA